MNDKEFLQWIHARLVEVHGENPNVDYMRRLQTIIDAGTIEELIKPFPNHVEQRRYYLGEWVPDKRLIALDEMLQQYYSVVSNQKGSHYHRNKTFKLWCEQYDYTQDEINAAKRRCR